MIPIDAKEAATILTRVAIENHFVCFNNFFYESDEKTEKQNAFNAKQIADFYKEIYEAVKPHYK